MSKSGLFDDLPEQSAPKVPEEAGRPRLREPERDQIELRAVDLDSLLGADHPARIVWAYVERLDLGVLEDRVRAREGLPGHPPASPRLLLALWLYATTQGVGSARALDRMCKSEDAYRWLCGGVSVNHHTLSDFRMGQADMLDELLTLNVAALAEAGLIDLDDVAQDGLRVRASAGSGSFRRRATLEKHRKQARRLVEKLKREHDDDPDASNRRVRAARERAARERLARVEQALAELDRLEEGRAGKKGKGGDREARVSTTDPEARVIKMPDGGFRPGYNMQIASAVEQQIIVGVDITASSSDGGLMRPMIEQIDERHDHMPRRYLADGGFAKNDDIDWADQEGVLVHCPPTKNKHGTDPLAPRADDKPGVAAWRRRMKSPTGKARYKRRVIAECINAQARQWNLRQITVRGIAKARTLLLWFALANNIFQQHRLQTQAAA